MSLEDAMQHVEGARFTAEMNLASSFNIFHKALRAHETFRELSESMDSSVASALVFGRLQALSRSPVEPGFENPFDVALAAYLAAIDLQAPDLVRDAAKIVAEARNCWWAAELSLKLVERIGSAQVPLPAHESAINQSLSDARVDGAKARNLLFREGATGILEALPQQLFSQRCGAISDVQSVFTPRPDQHTYRGSIRKSFKRRRPGKIAA